MTTQEILKRAVEAKKDIRLLTEQEKNDAIEIMAKSLEEAADEILRENEVDAENARGKISEVMLDRLTLT